MRARAAPERSSRRQPGRSEFRFDRRSSGILLHPTSLPGPHGSGDIGPAAHAFVDFLAAAGQRWWQMLPVGPPGAPPGNSPYSSYSAFAGSVWLIGPELMRDDGLLSARDVAPLKTRRVDEVDYPAAYRHRGQLLRRAFANFEGDPKRRAPFEAFRKREAAWLDDYALFVALREHHGNRQWLEWPRDLKFRRSAALAGARRTFADEIRFHEFGQYVFDRQWTRLRGHAHARSVGLIGDIPIFVGLDSSDGWANPGLFLLDAQAR